MISLLPVWFIRALAAAFRTTAILFIVVLPALTGARALAQGELSLFKLDDSGYPVLSAQFYPVDAAGNTIKDLGTGDLKVIENGVEREILSLSCPPPRPPQALSSVLMIDISSSMQTLRSGSQSNMEIAQSAARAWVNVLQLGVSECAVASFNTQSFLNQDFTSDRARLLSAIDRLEPNNGTNYDAAFITQPAGALRIVERGQKKRVVVFLTDGAGDGTEDEIIRIAQQTGATIYCVTIGMPAPDLVKNVAERTGGAWFENIQSAEEAETVYQVILGIAQGMDPCTIQWRSGPLCVPLRSAEVSIPSHSLRGIARWPVRQELVPRLSFEPMFISMGEVRPGTTRDTTITIIAHNQPVRISSVTTDDPRFTILGGAPPPDRVLNPGENMTVQVRFTPTDSSYAMGMLVVNSDACSNTDAYFYGGYVNRPVTYPPLRVVMPNGGEELPVGADTVITWAGTLPESTVRLEYSTDEGATWNLIEPLATGLRHAWKVPPTPSRRCLMRATQVVEPEDVVVLLGHTGSVFEAHFSSDGQWVVTGGGDSTVRIWNARSGENVQIFKLSVPITGAEFNPDGTQVLVSCMERYRGDYATLYDWRTGALVRKFAGTSSAGGIGLAVFTPDGSNIILGHADDHIERCTLEDVTVFKARPHVSNQRITSINFSPDGSYMAVSYGFSDTIKILNARTGAEVRTIVSPGNAERREAIWSADGSRIAIIDEGITIYDFPAFTMRLQIPVQAYTAAFSPNGRYIALAPPSGTMNGSFSVYDASTGALVKTFLHRLNGDVLKLRFSADSRRIISGGTEGIGKIWDFDPPVFLPDVSDALWAIVQPVAAVADLDMGDAIVGTAKDSLIIAYVCNGGDGVMSVTDISIEGAQAGDFSIVSGDAPFVLGAGECAAVEFRFRPPQTGPRSAEVVVTTSVGTVRRGIRGTGVRQQLDLAAQVIDFGGVIIGDAKDTTVEIVILNTGTDAAVIDATKLLGPDTEQFSIVNGDGSFTLAAGEGRRMTLRFAPRRVGRTSGRLVFQFSRAGSPLTVVLFGEGLCPGADAGASHTLQLGVRDMEVAAGDTFLIPVFIGDQRNFLGTSGEYRMSIRVNRRLLFPLDSFSLEGASAYSTVAGDTLIHYAGHWSGAGDTLLRLGFLAGLGDGEETEVGLDAFAWNFDCPVTVNLSTHVVRVKVCREGGTPRLFIDNGESLSLKPVRPNPAGGRISIEFSTIESGRTDLYLVDVLGNRAATIMRAELPAGAHVLDFDISRLPAGLYHCVLQTPSSRVTTGVMIGR